MTQNVRIKFRILRLFTALCQNWEAWPGPETFILVLFSMRFGGAPIHFADPIAYSLMPYLHTPPQKTFLEAWRSAYHHQSPSLRTDPALEAQEQIRCTSTKCMYIVRVNKGRGFMCSDIHSIIHNRAWAKHDHIAGTPGNYCFIRKGKIRWK